MDVLQQNSKPVKLIRITTIPAALDKLLVGQLKFMKENGFDVYMVSSHAANFQKIADREGSKFFPVNMTRTISPFKDIISLVKLVRLFKQLKPSIVHSHTPKAGLLGMLAAKIVGVPVRIHTVAGLPLMETTGLKRKILEIVEYFTCWCATAVYPVSFILQKIIITNKYCHPKKLKVIGNGSSNGINVSFYSPYEGLESKVNEIRSTYNLNDSHFVFIFIGRLVRDKGIIELISAFSELKKKYANVRLILVGPFEQDLDALPQHIIDEIQNDSYIFLAGYQDEVRPYLASSNVLVLPSYREGFPNVPMQAACFNLPSIVTNINGCNEIIEQGKNGLIVEPKDAEDLKNAMERLITDKALYDNCKQHAREMVVSRFDQKQIWKLLLNEYNQFLKK